jgi:ribonuclease P protein component
LTVQRLQTRPQFQAVLAGKIRARTAHFALHSCAIEMPIALTETTAAPAVFPFSGLWMGAMVPKRWAKRAVTRNAIKRQIYNVSPQFQHSLPAHAHLVRLRAAFDRTQFVSASSLALKAAVRAELLDLFTQASVAHSKQALP